MKLYTLKYMFLSLCAATMFVACDDDDALEMVETSCTDGIMNGTETGVDCGGTSCAPCEDAGEEGEEMMVTPPDFSGTYAQVDFMGRPGINTVLSIPDFKGTLTTKQYHLLLQNFIRKILKIDWKVCMMCMLSY
ncbi:hypothetical protein ACU8V7_02215 [Zobellia nedashkovskayae]